MKNAFLIVGEFRNFVPSELVGQMVKREIKSAEEVRDLFPTPQPFEDASVLKGRINADTVIIADKNGKTWEYTFRGPLPEIERSRAIMTNTKVWCRRFKVACNEAKDFATADRLYPKSVRRGPITLAAARLCNQHGIDDQKERLSIGVLVADQLINRMDTGAKYKSYTADNLSPELYESWEKHRDLVLTLVELGWNARVQEKARPPLINMLLDAARGK